MREAEEERKPFIAEADKIPSSSLDEAIKTGKISLRDVGCDYLVKRGLNVRYCPKGIVQIIHRKGEEIILEENTASWEEKSSAPKNTKEEEPAAPKHDRAEKEQERQSPDDDENETATRADVMIEAHQQPTGTANVESKQQKQKQSQREPCRFFQWGKCNRGDKCEHPHIITATASSTPTTRPPIACHFWNGQKGSCHNGNGCRFAHNIEAVQQETNADAARRLRAELIARDIIRRSLEEEMQEEETALSEKKNQKEEETTRRQEPRLLETFPRERTEEARKRRRGGKRHKRKRVEEEGMVE